MRRYLLLRTATSISPHHFAVPLPPGGSDPTSRVAPLGDATHRAAMALLAEHGWLLSKRAIGRMYRNILRQLFLRHLYMCALQQCLSGFVESFGCTMTTSSLCETTSSLDGGRSLIAAHVAHRRSHGAPPSLPLAGARMPPPPPAEAVGTVGIAYPRDTQPFHWGA